MSKPDRAAKCIQSPAIKKKHTRSPSYEVAGINEREQLFEKISTCNKLAAINEAARVAAVSKMAIACIAAEPLQSTNSKFCKKMWACVTEIND